MHLSAWSQRRPSACARGVVLASAVAFGAVAGCGAGGASDGKGGAGDGALSGGKSAVSVGGASGSAAVSGMGGSTFGASGATGSGGSVLVGGSSSTSGTGAGATSGCTTTLSGVVTTPAGTLPLYNVMLYVPSMALAPLPDGASCDTCNGVVSGDPVASALSDEAGRFAVDNVPTGTDIPLVIQIGKWRREVTVPSVIECRDNPVAPELTRLPRNKAEGHLPRIALSTGGLDALECLLLKVGIDKSEFTTPDEDNPTFEGLTAAFARQVLTSGSDGL